MRATVPATVLVLAAGLGTGAGSAAAEDDPWQVLDRFRRSLEGSGPQQAGFVQTFVPFGFAPEDGETERGSLAIDLPDCLRWDYSPPFEKSFLLCGSTIHHWSPGEPVGQRYDLTRQAAPGLDFFLLSMDELRRLYEAELGVTDGDLLRLILRPLEPTDDVALVQVTIDRDRERLRELIYHDSQSNENRFVLGDYRDGAPDDRFAPPDGIEWEEP